MKLTPNQKKAGGLLLLLVLFAGGSSAARDLPGPKTKKGKGKSRKDKVLETLPIVRAAALKYDIPVPVILAVLDVESWGNQYATSYQRYPKTIKINGKKVPHPKAGQLILDAAGNKLPLARGYMQLIESTAALYKVPWDYNPETNIDAGVNLLSDLYRDFSGDWYAVFTAYNAGPARLKLQKNGTYTKNYRMVYVNEVLTRMEQYRNIQ